MSKSTPSKVATFNTRIRLDDGLNVLLVATLSLFVVGAGVDAWRTDTLDATATQAAATVQARAASTARGGAIAHTAARGRATMPA